MPKHLAPEYMSMSDLWKAAMNDYYSLDPMLMKGLTGKEKQRTWRQLGWLLYEIRFRGDQLPLGGLGQEKVARD